MLLRIEPDGSVPIYQQIRDRVVEAIAGGQAPAGSPLPSTRQLAVDLGVNVHTVSKSYDILRQEGLVRVTRKSGAVIRPDPTDRPPDPRYVEEWAARLRTLLAEAAAQGLGRRDILACCGAALDSFVATSSPSRLAGADPVGQEES